MCLCTYILVLILLKHGYIFHLNVHTDDIVGRLRHYSQSFLCAILTRKIYICVIRLLEKPNDDTTNRLGDEFVIHLLYGRVHNNS